MALISKDQLFQVTAHLPWEDVPLRITPNGEIIGKIRLRGLTGEEVSEWQDAATHQVGKRKRQSKHASAMLVVASAINEDGTDYFDKRDTLKVSQMPNYTLSQLAEVALKLSGLSDDEDARELVEEMAEDFDSGPSEPDISG